MHFPAFSRARPCAIKQAPFSYVDELGEELVTQCMVAERKGASAKLRPSRVSKFLQGPLRKRGK